MQVADLFARLTLRPDRKSFDAGDKLLSGVKKALVGLAVIKTGEWLTGLVESTIDAGSAAHDTALKLGITSQAVQGLQYAAKLSSSDIDGVVTGYAHMAKGLQEAKTKGTGPFVEGLQELGISMSDPAVKAGNLDAIFGLVADKMKTTTSAQVRLSAAMNLSGRSGSALIPLWMEGAEGIAKMRQEAIDLGYAMSDETNDALESMGDDVDRVKMGLIGMRNEAVVAILPYLKELIGDMLAWVKANKQIIAQRLAAVLKAVAQVAMFLGSALGLLIDTMQWLAKNFGFVLAVLAGLTAAMIVYKYESIKAAIATAIEWALAALPFILLAALIVGLILIVEDLYTWFVGGDSVFKEFYESIKHWIGEKVTGVINFFIRGINTMIEAVESLLQKLIDLGDNPLVQAGGQIAGFGAAADIVSGTHEHKASLGRVGELKEGDWSGDPTRDEQIANMRKRGMVQGPGGNWIQGSASGGAGIDANVKIDITIPPGANAKEVADTVSDAMTKFWGGQMRRLAGANGGNR